MRDYQICANCVMDTSDSQITFDEHGVCDHCRGFKEHVEPNWHPAATGETMCVCVGMQMLAKSSEEGDEPGLGWIDGIVERITFPAGSPRGLLPHMGWSTITAKADEPLLSGLDHDLGFYFLHSYRFRCNDPADVIATADYAEPFHGAVRRGNVHGVQFHPEKSHHNGTRLLKNFAES